MLTVVEQQGADWKFDRALFKACRVDKVTFCSSQAPLNDGQVYNCLVAHKDNPAMSQQVCAGAVCHCLKDLSLRLSRLLFPFLTNTFSTSRSEKQQEQIQRLKHKNYKEY